MNNSILVSIVMATYNSIEFLPRSIESVLEQTFGDFEFIIVEDVSQDDTYARLKEYRDYDSRINIIKNHRNFGLATSLNIAIDISRGQFIARMDADDICVPHRLERQIDFLLKHPDIDALGAGIEAINQEGCFLEYRYRPENHAELAGRIFYENPFFHSTVIARRRFYRESGGYNARYRRCQDYDLWLRTYSTWKFHNLQEPLVRYRVRDTASWRSVFYSTFVLLNALRRERLLTRNWWIAFRGPALKFFEKCPHSAPLELFRGLYQRKKALRKNMR